MRIFSAIVLILCVAASAFAQKTKKLEVFVDFDEPARITGKKISVIVEWWCGPSDVAVAEYNRMYFAVNLRKIQDLRNLKSLTFRLATTEEVPEVRIRQVTVGGVPFLPARGDGGAGTTLDEEYGFKYEGVGSIDNDLPTSFRPAVLKDVNLVFSKTRPVKVLWSRTDLTRHPQMATRLTVNLTTRDGCRSDSKLEMMIETTDGQFIHIPVGTIGDNQTKTINHILNLPIPADGIKRVHFWFSNRLFLTNRVIRNDDSLAQADDVDLTYSIEGSDSGPAIEFARGRSVRLRDWKNKVSDSLSTKAQTFADDFMNELTLFAQTGDQALNWQSSTGQRMRVEVTVRAQNGIDYTVIRPNSEPNSGGTLVSGSFNAGNISTSLTNNPLPLRFRLKDINSVTVRILPATNPAGTARFSESWDLAGLAIGMRKRGWSDDIFSQTSIFANLEENARLTYNFNQSGSGSSFKTYNFRAAQIVYVLSPGPVVRD